MPDLSSFCGLERLFLTCCASLEKLSFSGVLTELQVVTLRGCGSLIVVPDLSSFLCCSIYGVDDKC